MPNAECRMPNEKSTAARTPPGASGMICAALSASAELTITVERIPAHGVARGEDTPIAREGRVGVESEAGGIGGIRGRISLPPFALGRLVKSALNIASGIGAD